MAFLCAAVLKVVLVSSMSQCVDFAMENNTAMNVNSSKMSAFLVVR